MVDLFDFYDKLLFEQLLNFDLYVLETVLSLEGFL